MARRRRRHGARDRDLRSRSSPHPAPHGRLARRSSRGRGLGALPNIPGPGCSANGRCRRGPCLPIGVRLGHHHPARGDRSRSSRGAHHGGADRLGRGSRVPGTRLALVGPSRPPTDGGIEPGGRGDRDHGRCRRPAARVPARGHGAGRHGARPVDPHHRMGLARRRRAGLDARPHPADVPGRPGEPPRRGGRNSVRLSVSACIVGRARRRGRSFGRRVLGRCERVDVSCRRSRCCWRRCC